MTEIKNLLAQSINEFKDKTNNATAIPCIYLPASNGLPYLIKDTASQIDTSVAIHLSSEQAMQEDGILNTGLVAVNTQEDLFAQFEYDPNVIIIDYNGFTLGINKSGEFNNVTQTYHYIGEVLLNRNASYVILDEDEATTLILSDSTTLWLDLDTEFGIPVYPSFVSTANESTPYITVSIKDSIGLNHVRQIDDTTLKQYKRDSIRLHLVNSTLQQAQDIARSIFMAPAKYQTFGLQDFPAWKTINEYTQSSFGLKQNVRTMDLMINYQLVTTTTNAIKYFKQIKATINNVIIQTVNIDSLITT